MNTDAVVDAEFVEENNAEKHGALAVREEARSAPPSLFHTDEPVEVIAKATKVADALKAVVVAKNLVSNIQGKEYPQVEAWLTLAAMLNINAITEWTRQIEGGWEARVVVRNGNGLDIAAAEAQCTRAERSWKNRDDYALRSMAQTRATSKALRSKLGFIMTLAGYQATPAEEIPSYNVSRSAESCPPGDTSRGAEGDTSASNHQPDTEKAREGARKVLFANFPELRNDVWRHTYLEQTYAKQSINDLTLDQLRDLYSRLKNNV